VALFQGWEGDHDGGFFGETREGGMATGQNLPTNRRILHSEGIKKRMNLREAFLPIYSARFSVINCVSALKDTNFVKIYW
jgi:hypothetical protein